jgi:hypothetical protein
MDWRFGTLLTNFQLAIPHLGSHLTDVGAQTILSLHLYRYTLSDEADPKGSSAI